MPSGIEVTVDFSGMDRFMVQYPQKVETWLDGEAEDVVTDIKLSFGESPSPPGGPPGVDTGTLRASVNWERTGRFERTLMDGVEYGQYLEDGTERMGARPWMRPAIERKRQQWASGSRGTLNLE